MKKINILVMSAKYSNREIDEMQKDIKDALIRIETQTVKTNGAVADVQKWRERVTGGLYVTLVIVIPILSWALYQVTTVDKQVEQGVRTVLKEYDITKQ